MTSVLAVSEPLEPATMLVSSVALGGPFPTKAWRVATRDDRDAAFVVAERLCAGRWVAYPLLLNEDAAREVTAIVERCGARAMEGSIENVRPLLSHLTRPFTATEMPASGAYQAVLPPEGYPVDPRVRLAGADDVDRLVDLYKDYELNRIPTIPRLRRFLAKTMERGPIAVMDEDGMFTAAMRVDARSRRFLYWSGQTVRPEYRGGGRSAALYGFMGKVGAELGMGGVVAVASTHHGRRRPEQELSPEQREALGMFRGMWMSVGLRSRRTIPGRYRPRRLWQTIEGRTSPRPAKRHR